jgi:hypothetical protein
MPDGDFASTRDACHHSRDMVSPIASGTIVAASEKNKMGPFYDMWKRLRTANRDKIDSLRTSW